MPFAALGLTDLVLRALKDQGYTTPTPIQAKSIPPILEGRDLLGCAQTGTGKTAAFSLPLIHRLSEMPADKSRRGPVLPRALILSPTRELAAQIGESVATYGKHVGLSHAVIFGGVSQHHQVRALQRGVDILIATPGRLIDLMEQRYVDLSAIRIFVLDEADRMLDMGFIQPIRTIAAALPKGPRQTLLFSATMPKEIMHLAESLLRDPVRVAVTPVASAAPKIEQSLYFVPMRRKQALLEHLLDDPAVTRAVVFTKTKHGADRVCTRLHRDGVDAVAIHGNKAQNYRIRALDAFRSGRMRVLVATDVAARGLDVDNVSHVFNFDLPMEPEAYVHRIGRTARAGASGIAISFCDSSERGLLRDVQRLLKKEIPVVPLPEGLPEPEAVPNHGPMGLAPGAPAAHHDDAEPDGHSSARRGHRGQGSGGERSGQGGRGRPSRGGDSAGRSNSSYGSSYSANHNGGGQPRNARSGQPHDRADAYFNPQAGSNQARAPRADARPSTRPSSAGPRESFDDARSEDRRPRTGGHGPRQDSRTRPTKSGGHAPASSKSGSGGAGHGGFKTGASRGDGPRGSGQRSDSPRGSNASNAKRGNSIFSRRAPKRSR